MNPATVLEPLLRGDPVRWRGLPAATVADFDAAFGAPAETAEAVLGVYPAVRRVYRLPSGAALTLWARDGRAVMVETSVLPPAAVLGELPEPCAILAQEILVPDAYAHEYLYCATGLLLTVARALDDDAPDRIVRCRGLAVLTRPEDLGPEYYQPFDQRIRWSRPT